MTKSSARLAAFALGLAAAVAAFQFFRKADFGTSPSAGGTVIGEIRAVSGQVERRPPKSVRMETVPAPRPYMNLDLIVTQQGASAELAFNQGTVLRLKENSKIVVELDATKPGGLLATLIDGSVALEAPGNPGTFRVFREGRETPLAELAKAESVPMIPSGATTESGLPETPAATPSAEAGAGLIITATVAEETSTSQSPQAPAKPGTPAERPDNSVLTNEDIVRQLRQQTGFFQRCYLNFIHRSRTAGSSSVQAPTGTVVAGFMIQTNGRVSDVKIVRSDFSDSLLHSCITEVVGRTQFRGFRGEKPVPVQEFPIQLQ